MKVKNFLLSLFMGVMAMCNVACDKDVAESDVPQAVKTTFQQMFPNTTDQWEKEKSGQLTAEFYYNHHEMEAWFQKDGTWTMTKKELSVSELPQAVLDYVSTNHSGLEIDEAHWVETPTEKYYLVELDRENKADIVLTFDESGSFIK